MSRSTSVPKRVGIAAFAVAALMLVGTACGGSSSKSDSSSSKSSESSGSSSNGGSSSGGDFKNCEELANAFSEFDSSLDPDGATANGEVEDVVKEMERISSMLPSEVRGDWKTVTNAFKKFADSMKGVDFNDPESMMDPDLLAKMEAAGEEMNSPEVEAAMNRLDAWGEKNCGAILN